MIPFLFARWHAIIWGLWLKSMDGLLFIYYLASFLITIFCRWKILSMLMLTKINEYVNTGVVYPKVPVWNNSTTTCLILLLTYPTHSIWIVQFCQNWVGLRPIYVYTCIFRCRFWFNQPFAIIVLFYWKYVIWYAML